MKWSEFKKLVEQTTKDTDPEIDFILFDVDYKPNLFVVIGNTARGKNRLMIEG